MQIIRVPIGTLRNIVLIYYLAYRLIIIILKAMELAHKLDDV